eukprot:CAMPEP_0118799556 /NCGR_PEP_ID=MMETSP1161-20130426/1727_1 /TAXON_ID=249345 /ORGANISM="Picochlorum oklahomensis, Strain CCMP2329" /LENGTH=623 /DNA_ID=CAMNT_0006727265 /DNA_START=143 /DNA_END=2014 /DNA_ORIENTATION=+
MVVQTRRSKRQKCQDENSDVHRISRSSSALDLTSPCDYTGVGKMTPLMDGGDKEGVVRARARSVLGVKHVNSIPTTTSPHEVTKVPQSMPTDDDDVFDGGHAHHAKSKTRSRVTCGGLPARCPTLEGHDTAVSLSTLPDSCLLEIFRHSSSDESGSTVEYAANPCMSVYPLVCQRWKDLLGGPSSVWEHVCVGSSLRRIDVDRMVSWMAKRAPSIKKVSYAFRGAFEYTTTAGALQEATNTVWDLIHVALGPKNLTAMIESLELTSLETQVYENILKHAAAYFPNLHSLSLSGLGDLSKDAMQGLEALKGLEHLSLRFDKDVMNPFQGENGSLPASIFAMTQLKSLTLETKGICSIQPAISTMKNLEELKLESMTNMASLPLMIVQLRNLTKLSLKGSKGLFGAANSSRNGGTIEPGTERMFWMIRSLPRLEQLNLDGCGIKEFPLLDSLPVNSSLKRLSMNDNPEMVFKKGLAAFQALEWVSMKSCNMPCVSSAVTALKNLRYLDISNNGLVECNGLGKLSKLRVLHASHNHFPSFPRDILALSNLKELHMYGCIYLEFPASLEHLTTAWKHMVRMDLRKGVAPHPARYQASSLYWLRKLDEAYEAAHQRSGVILFDASNDE